MVYIDDRGRPELVVNPAIKVGAAAFRHLLSTDVAPTKTSAADRAVPVRSNKPQPLQSHQVLADIESAAEVAVGDLVRISPRGKVYWVRAITDSGQLRLNTTSRFSHPEAALRRPNKPNYSRAEIYPVGRPVVDRWGRGVPQPEPGGRGESGESGTRRERHR